MIPVLCVHLLLTAGCLSLCSRPGPFPCVLGSGSPSSSFLGQRGESSGGKIAAQPQASKQQYLARGQGAFGALPQLLPQPGFVTLGMPFLKSHLYSKGLGISWASLTLDQGLTNFFYKRPDRKYFWLCRPRGPCCDYSTLPLLWGSSCCQDGNKECLCVPIKFYLQKRGAGWMLP